MVDGNFTGRTRIVQSRRLIEEACNYLRKELLPWMVPARRPRSLIGRLFGPKPPLHFIKRAVTYFWKRKSGVEVIHIDDVTLVFKLYNEEDKANALNGGPLAARFSILKSGVSRHALERRLRGLCRSGSIYLQVYGQRET